MILLTDAPGRAFSLRRARKITENGVKMTCPPPHLRKDHIMWSIQLPVGILNTHEQTET